MKKGNINSRIVVGDDISQLFDNNLNNSSSRKFSSNPINVSRNRLKFALSIFVLFFVIFSIRNTFLSVFPGDVISEPKTSLALATNKPLPDIYDRSGKNLMATTVKTLRASVFNRSNYSVNIIKSWIYSFSKYFFWRYIRPCSSPVICFI